MVPWLDLFLLSLATIVSYALVGAYRRYALEKNILDKPNERSLHQTPTPSGAGLIIVILFLGYVFWRAWVGALPRDLALPMLIGGGAVAAVGWFDDRYTLSDPVRMAVWIPTAILTVGLLGGLPSLALGTLEISLGIVGSVISVIGVIWMVNLYNFMDGIDGLAGAEAITTSSFGSILLWVAGARELAALMGVLAGISLGFVAWNWDPAKVFMGDVASGFLGFTFAVLGIFSENEGIIPLVLWGILLAVFLIDSTFTVIRRAFNGEPWYEAHRSHAYQLAVQQGHSHGTVTLSILMLNIMLGALAVLTWMRPSLTIPLLGVVIASLGVIWYKVVNGASHLGRETGAPRSG